MIESFSLKIGPAQGEPGISLASPAITVFVGPNNSGKSLVLQEIHAACADGARNNSKILGEVAFAVLTQEAAEAALNAVRTAPRVGENISANSTMIQIGRGGPRYTFPTISMPGRRPTPLTIAEPTSRSTLLATLRSI